MNPEEVSTMLMLTFKAIGLIALAVIIIVIVAYAHVEEYPDDDGEIL